MIEEPTLMEQDVNELINGLDDIEGYFEACGLTELEKHVMRLRYSIPYAPMTVDQISRLYRVSKQRISQRTEAVLHKIRRHKSFFKCRQGMKGIEGVRDCK